MRKELTEKELINIGKKFNLISNPNNKNPDSSLAIILKHGK